MTIMPMLYRILYIVYVYHKRGFLNRLYDSFHYRYKKGSQLIVPQIELV
jgi:hypothetical protein